MASYIDRAHPFRSSDGKHSSLMMQREAGAVVSSGPIEKSTQNEPTPKEESSWLDRLKRRLKFIGASALLLAIPAVFFYFGGENDSHEDTSAKSSFEDERDFREVSFARNEAGFFARIFCTGARVSRFCRE